MRSEPGHSPYYGKTEDDVHFYWCSRARASAAYRHAIAQRALRPLWGLCHARCRVPSARRRATACFLGALSASVGSLVDIEPSPTGDEEVAVRGCRRQAQLKVCTGQHRACALSDGPADDCERKLGEYRLASCDYLQRFFAGAVKQSADTLPRSRKDAIMGLARWIAPSAIGSRSARVATTLQSRT